MEVGTILVADVKTSAGNYCNFFVVSSLVKKTFYAKRIGCINTQKVDKITNMIRPDPTSVFEKEFKISNDAGGYFVGDNKDKKNINKMYVVETPIKDFKIVFDGRKCS